MARQKEMAFGAASGALTNRVLWMFDVRMDPTNVTEWLKHVRDNAPVCPYRPAGHERAGQLPGPRAAG